MFQADRNHLHHLMMRAATERKRIVLAIYVVAASFCVMALIVAVSRSAFLGIALILVEVVVVLLMRNREVRREVRILAFRERLRVRQAFYGRQHEAGPNHVG